MILFYLSVCSTFFLYKEKKNLLVVSFVLTCVTSDIRRCLLTAWSLFAEAAECFLLPTLYCAPCSGLPSAAFPSPLLGCLLGERGPTSHQDYLSILSVSIPDGCRGNPLPASAPCRLRRVTFELCVHWLISCLFFFLSLPFGWITPSSCLFLFRSLLLCFPFLLFLSHTFLLLFFFLFHFRSFLRFVLVLLVCVWTPTFFLSSFNPLSISLFVLFFSSVHFYIWTSTLISLFPSIFTSNFLVFCLSLTHLLLFLHSAIPLHLVFFLSFFGLTHLHCIASLFLSGAPVFPLFALRHHAVPSAPGPHHRSGPGRLGHGPSGQEARQDNPSQKPRPLQGLRDSLIGLRYYPNPASRLADLGRNWLQLGSRPLLGSLVHSLQLDRADVATSSAFLQARLLPLLYRPLLFLSPHKSEPWDHSLCLRCLFVTRLRVRVGLLWLE